MEKISGILPERPRLKSQREPLPPVRPGAPGFGRIAGSSEIRDRVSVSSMKNIGPFEYTNYRNPKEARQSRIVEELSREFFMTPVLESNELAESILQEQSLPSERVSTSL